MAFDLEINLSASPGVLKTENRSYFTLSRSTFKDGLKVRAYGHTQEVIVKLPQLTKGHFTIANDSASGLQVMRGETLAPVKPHETAVFHMDGSFHTITRIG